MAFDLSICLHWLDETLQIVPRLFIVVVAAFIAIRFASLRLALRGNQLSVPNQFFAIVVFALLAVIGTHSGIPIDIHQGLREIDLNAQWPSHLTDSQAIVGFRDTMILASGLIGGPWVGLGTGLIAGAERYYLGGFAALASAVASVFLGVFSGSVRHYKPAWVTAEKGIFMVALIGTLIHRLLILLLVRPFEDALTLSWEVIVPVGVVNVLGCVLFFWVMRDLDRDRLENDVQEIRLLMLQAELRSLRAQVEPHFLNNTLNDLQYLISHQPELAIAYVGQLAAFFNFTRQYSSVNTIRLEQELEQVQRYLQLQSLALGNKLHYQFAVPEALLGYRVLPGCLLTLVENALKHGFKGRPAPYQLVVSGQEDHGDLRLTVSDNGKGIAPERLQLLGHQPIPSDNKGGGVALHQLLQCLRLVFGEQAGLTIDSTIGTGTVALIKHVKRSG